jgi:diguanylate cyclase (GGDEF)-like protein
MSPMAVLCVSEDPVTLRHLARCLGPMRFDVRAASNAQAALAAAMCGTVDIVIVDSAVAGDGAWSVIQTLRGQQAIPESAQAFYLSRHKDAASLKTAYNRGFDDFLSYPVVAGEIASRLRAAARMIEFHRRRQITPGPDAETGLPNRAALAAAAHECLTNGGQGWMAVGDIDYFQRIPRRFGQKQANELLQAITDRLLDTCDDSTLLAAWDTDRFGVVSTHGSDHQRSQWIGRICNEVLGKPLAIGNEEVVLTASFGWAPLEESGQTSLLRCEEALQLAKTSGRNTICNYNDLIHDRQAGESTRSNHRCLARDVAAPITIAMHPDETVEQSQRLMEIAGVALLPVVDREGKLVGTINRQRAPQDTDVRLGDSRARGLSMSGSLRYLRNTMNTQFATVEFDATFDDAVRTMTEQNSTAVFVVQNRIPLGIVTRSMVAALQQPVDRSTFDAGEEEIATWRVHEPCLVTLD